MHTPAIVLDPRKYPFYTSALTTSRYLRNTKSKKHCEIPQKHLTMLFPFTNQKVNAAFTAPYFSILSPPQAQIEQAHELEDMGTPSPTYASSTSPTPLPRPCTLDTPLSRTPSPEPRYSLYLNQSPISSPSASIGSRDWDTEATRDTASPYSDTRSTYWDVEANRNIEADGNIEGVFKTNPMSARDACCGICIVTVRVLGIAVLACIPTGIMALVVLVVYNKIMRPEDGWAGF